METSHTHFRSISLPARLYPVGQKNELQKLNSWQVSPAKGYALSSEGIKSDLLRLEELYCNVQELKVRSPALNNLQASSRSSMEELLSESVDLLDACGTIRELFQTVRENVRTLQSALRRKSIDSGIVQQDIATYFTCRKKVNKSAAKTLKSLKSLEHRSNADHCGDHYFRELAGTTVGVFRSIIGFLNSSTAARNVNPAGWSLVSRLMLTRSSSSEVGIVNEIGNVDFALKCLQGKMKKNGSRVHLDDQVRLVQVKLQEVDDVIESVEMGLDRLLRQLVQTRVNLLNILTDLIT